jgi:hypothetical protein
VFTEIRETACDIEDQIGVSFCSDTRNDSFYEVQLAYGALFKGGNFIANNTSKPQASA